jgi:phage tail sheath protein FI
MGYGFPRPIANEIDLSYYVDTLMKGISCVQGVTQKGPLSKAVLIGSAEEFERVFGGNLDSYDFPLVAKRALSYGATLWVSRVAHRNPADGTTAAAAATAMLPDRAGTPVNTLRVTASSPGTWSNGMKIAVTVSDLDENTLFNLNVYKGDDAIESLPNLSMDPANENYVEKVKSDNVVLEDLESTTEIPSNRPALTNGTLVALAGGNDGLVGLADADYIGIQAQLTGMYAFDGVNDALQLATPGVSSPAVIAAGLAYCESRKDLLYVCETPANSDPQEAVDFRRGQGDYTHAAFNSSYGALYYPKLRVYDAEFARERTVSVLGDVLGIMANNDFAANEARVPAGLRRGLIRNALGVDYNLAAPAVLANANLASENQINPVVNFADYGLALWGAQTLQRQASLLREVNVRRMTLVIKRSITKFAWNFIHEPNDVTSWRAFYLAIDPKFREWKSQRFFYDYRIVCDQNARTLDDAKLNTPESVQRGEFKVKMFYKPIVGIKWILLDFVITRLDATYDESIVDMAA